MYNKMEHSVDLPVIDRQPKVRRSTYIANHLREMIFSGTLKPGDRLPTEEQLCDHFGVSRTTLRESVQMLRVSGLLEVTPGRGSFIRLPDLTVLMKDLSLLGQYSSMNTSDVSSLRVLLESDMVKYACEAPLEKRKELNGFVISRQGSAEDIEDMEGQWHLAIAKLAGNGLSMTMLEVLLSMQKNERVKKFTNPDSTISVMSMQIRINSAIIEGDQESAMRVMASYLGNNKDIQ